jgi:GntR family transcriptional regulator, arabinose operon transcriptional repressor
MKKGLFRLDLRDDRLGRVKHERLKSHLVNQMAAGCLKPGEALPSESEFAKRLGITRVTVRQAMASLENEGLIRRVQGKGNYVEESAQRRLNRGLDIFALVAPETRGSLYASLLHGFEAAAGNLRHQTIVCNSGNDLSRQGDIVLQLMDQKVGGVAIVPVTQAVTPAYQIRQLQEHGIPVVFCHRRVEGVPAPLLAIPFHEVGRTAGRALVEHGHRHVAFFTSLWAPSTRAYEEGLKDAMQAAGADVLVESACIGNITLEEESVWPVLKEVFDRPERPTAIFANSDLLVEMAYLLLPRLGLRVPQDVSLLGVGGTWRERGLTRRLTSVVMDEVVAGRETVSLLNEMRQGNRPIDDNEETVMELSLSEGKTLAALPPKCSS